MPRNEATHGAAKTTGRSHWASDTRLSGSLTDSRTFDAACQEGRQARRAIPGHGLGEPPA